MKIASVRLSAATAALLLSASAGLAGPFNTGNLVVSQVGDGTAALSSAAAPVLITEIRISDGSVVQSIALPTTAASSGNRALVDSGSATSDGFLALSSDGRFLVLAGYNANVGTASVASAAGINRVVGRIAADGTFDTTTELTDSSYAGNNIRSAASSNGTDIWLGGTASSAANGGVRYTTLGSNSSIQLSSNVTNARTVNIFSGQLYTSTMSGAFRGVSTVGAGLPTTSGQTTTLLSGFDPSTTSPQSIYDFVFTDADTLYVCDDRSLASGGGLQKWTLSGSTWSLAYTLTSGLTAGVRGLTSVTAGGVTTLYATTADAVNASSGNKIVSIVDTGSSSSFTVLATAPGNTWYKGIDVAPSSPTPPPCYANCDGSTIPPVLNVNDFTCFLNKYAAGDSYANCDGSTIPPVLNVNDFTCFVNQYAVGCP